MTKQYQERRWLDFQKEFFPEEGYPKLFKVLEGRMDSDAPDPDTLKP